jgi:hypothetical protein
MKGGRGQMSWMLLFIKDARKRGLSLPHVYGLWLDLFRLAPTKGTIQALQTDPSFVMCSID